MSPTAARVLVVDDDPQILKAVRTSLGAHGFEVVTAGNGETAVDMLAREPVDVVLLDLGLPGIDGLDVIERVRTWSDVPIIILSVRDTQHEKARALDAGADDYLTKPFGMQELLARMRAVRRRVEPSEAVEPSLRFEDLEIDRGRRLVRLNGRPVHLTPTEYRLLEALATNAGKLLTHGWLLHRVWGPAYESEAQYLRVFIRQLRKKLGDDATRPRFILTEPGLGYRWKPDPLHEAGAS